MEDKNILIRFESDMIDNINRLSKKKTFTARVRDVIMSGIMKKIENNFERGKE